MSAFPRSMFSAVPTFSRISPGVRRNRLMYAAILRGGFVHVARSFPLARLIAYLEAEEVFLAERECLLKSLESYEWPEHRQERRILLDILNDGAPFFPWSSPALFSILKCQEPSREIVPLLPHLKHLASSKEHGILADALEALHLPRAASHARSQWHTLDCWLLQPLLLKDHP
jgi:hypothetical protein